MAIAIPPRVIVLMVMPRLFITSRATASDSGMATTEMIVVRKFQRKKNRMMMTRRAPSRRAAMTLWTASEMKSACRKMARFTWMPEGSWAWMRSSSSSRRSVNSSVFSPGCFKIDRITAGSAFTDAVPKRGRGPISTCATSRRSTGTSPRIATTVVPMSSTLCARPSPRINTSRPLAA